jgi:hypothetical protein
LRPGRSPLPPNRNLLTEVSDLRRTKPPTSSKETAKAYSPKARSRWNPQHVAMRIAASRTKLTSSNPADQAPHSAQAAQTAMKGNRPSRPASLLRAANPDVVRALPRKRRRPQPGPAQRRTQNARQHNREDGKPMNEEQAIKAYKTRAKAEIRDEGEKHPDRWRPSTQS